MSQVLIEQVAGADARVDALLARHFADMRAASPEESCHCMTATELRTSGAQVFALRDHSGTVCAIGALKPFADGVELKSMHTAREARGLGYGRLVLETLLGAAREQGARRAWLETGSADSFIPARELYRSVGFSDCPPFGDYRPDPLSTFMTCAL